MASSIAHAQSVVVRIVAFLVQRRSHIYHCARHHLRRESRHFAVERKKRLEIVHVGHAEGIPCAAGQHLSAIAAAIISSMPLAPMPISSAIAAAIISSMLPVPMPISSAIVAAIIASMPGIPHSGHAGHSVFRAFGHSGHARAPKSRHHFVKHHKSSASSNSTSSSESSALGSVMRLKAAEML